MFCYGRWLSTASLFSLARESSWLLLDCALRVHLTIKPLDTIRVEKGEIPAKLFEFLWAKDILLRFFRSAIHAKSILQCSPFVRQPFLQ
jgi:hypothetical protein